MELSGEFRCARGLVRISQCGMWAASAEGRTVRVRDATTMGSFTSHGVELAGPVVSLSFGHISGRVAVAAACAEGRVAVIDVQTGECVADVFAGAVGVVRVALSDCGALVIISGGGVGALLVDANTDIDTDAETATTATPRATGFVRAVSSHTPVRWLPGPVGGRFAVLAAADKGWLIVDVFAGTVVARSITEPQSKESKGTRTKVSTQRAVYGLLIGDHGVVTWGSAMDTNSERLYTLDGRVIGRTLRLCCTIPETRMKSCMLGVRSWSCDSARGVLALGGYDGVVRIIQMDRWALLSAVVPGEPTSEEGADVAVYREQARVGRAASKMQHTIGAVEVTRGDGAGGVTHCALRNGWLAAVDERARNVVCIYQHQDAGGTTLRGALVLRSAVSAIAWVAMQEDPAGALIAVSGGSQAYVWRRQGAAAVAVERKGTPHALTRIIGANANPDATRLLLVDPGAGLGVMLYVDE